MNQRRIVFVLSVSVLMAATGAEARIETDVKAPAGKQYTYKEAIDKRGVKRGVVMEVYFPKDHDPANKPVPGIIMFHGGAWAGGDLSQFRYLCHYFAGRGLVAATANYRLGMGKETCIIDAKSAIRWYKQNAKELGIDPKRIITGGGSAGGHVCLLATLEHDLNDPNDPKDMDTSVVAYLLFNPALRARKGSKTDFMNYVTADLAPAIVFFGSEDRGWGGDWKRKFETLQSRGIQSIDYWIADGQPHGFFNNTPWLQITLAEADRFLNSLGLIEGKPTVSVPEGDERLVAVARRKGSTPQETQAPSGRKEREAAKEDGTEK